MCAWASPACAERRVTAGADRPDRLVRHDQLGDLLGGQPVETVLQLPVEHGERLVRLALLERFADAHDRRQGSGTPPSPCD